MPSASTPFVSRLVRWRYLVFINLILIGFLGFTLGREWWHARDIQREINHLQAQADTLTKRNSELAELQSAVQTQSFIEREARLKLGLKKPGEEVVVIQPRETSGTPNAEQQVDGSDPLHLVIPKETSRPQVPNATKWWYYFFNKNAFTELARYDD
ncbi:septum formation initiator family protein [Candidatus Uhrbacteria bacterium]|nr:septum formation initiator family protein [Candidatus Uhrbacteria bacterium]